MAPDAPRRRRPRPVADAPIDGLLARTEDLAKGWLLALLSEAPLHEAPGILTDSLTRDGPRVCDAALRALADDRDLRRLQAGGALRPLAARVGEMVGTAGADAAAVSRAVDALQAILWSALREELRGPMGAGGAGGLGGPEPELVLELAERVAVVAALLREAALECLGAGPGGGEPELAAVPEHGSERERPFGGRSAPGQGAGGAGGGGIDPTPPTPPAALAWRGPTSVPHAPPARWSRTASGPLWMSALEEEVRQCDAAVRPLSLLLAELEDADRVVASIPPDRAPTALGDFVAALRRVVRRQDILVCESDARAWVIARETARSGAHSLGARIAEAVGETSGWSGAPLVASVGVAVLGEDGDSSDELIEAAEEARFAASARGIEVSRRVPDADR